MYRADAFKKGFGQDFQAVQGGVAFGFVKGVLIASVLFLVLTAFLPKGTPLIRDSMSAPYISIVSEKLAGLVSSEIRSDFSAKLETLKKSWNIFK